MNTVEVTIRRGGRPLTISVKDHGIPLGVRDHVDIAKSMLSAFSVTRQRCYTPTCRDYKYYGGRGIGVCQRWLDDPVNMLIDMGLRPDGYTLERVDNDADYAPENCVWRTRKEQMQNTRLVKEITYQGETHCVSEWERILGFNPGTLKSRLGPLGYTIEEAMIKPVKCGGLLASRDYPRIRNKCIPAPKHRPRPKFEGEDLQIVRFLVATGLSRSAVARMFNSNITTVSDAVDRLGAYVNA